MSYGVKYRTEFSDIRGLNWKVDILEDAYESDITTLTATGDPLIFYFDNNDDDVFDAIRPIRAKLNVYSFTDFALADLYAVEDMHFQVNIYQNEELYLTGYIETQYYQEPYDMAPYPVSVSIICGLELLKEIEFKNSGEYYNGMKRESEIILEVLDKIGYDEFKEYVNLYDDDMDSEVDDSPMDQVNLDVDVFKDRTCWEVLILILNKYNAFIRQRGGVFEIIRPVELLANTVYGRYFTDISTKTEVSFSTDQYIKRTLTHPDRTTRQVPGGILMVQRPAARVDMKQDYGNKESWIDNYELKANTYDDVSRTWDYWTPVNLNGFDPVVGNIPGEKDGCHIPGYTSRVYWLAQAFGTHNTTSTNTHYISFDYQIFNFSGGTLSSVNVYVKLMTANAVYYLYGYDDAECWWDTDEKYINIELDAPEGLSGWQTYARNIPNIPDNGPFIIFLYNATHATSSSFITCYKNIKFGATADTIIVKRKKMIWWNPAQMLSVIFGRKTFRTYNDVEEIISNEYSKDNSINGIIDEREYLLGDVVDSNIDNEIEQFSGALLLGTPQTRIDEVYLTGNSGEMLITCNGIGRYAYYNTSPTQTAADFVTDYASVWLPTGVTVSSDDNVIRFTNTTAGDEFSGETTCSYHFGNLQGIVIKSMASHSLVSTGSWNTRGGSEAQALLELITDEIATMYSRPKQLIQMALRETAEALAINVNANMQDALNLYGDEYRVFSVNRGEFDVRNRSWSLDLFEIGSKTAVPDVSETKEQVKYGYLYNWYVAAEVNYAIAGAGWHVPTGAEITTLRTYCGGTTVAGTKLRETGFVYWSDASGAIAGTNDYEFNARSSGARSSSEGSEGIFHSGPSSPWANDSAFYMWGCDSGYYSVIMYNSNNHNIWTLADESKRGYGMAIRLIKDSTTLSDGESGSYTGNDGKTYRTICIGTQEWLADNLAETKFRNGDDIPNVTDNDEWAALTTEAYCAYDNDEGNALMDVEVQASPTADSTVVTVDSTLYTIDED